MPQKIKKLRTSKAKKTVQKKFPYQLEFCPNPDVIQIHTRSRFPEVNDYFGLGLRFMVKECKKKGKKINPLYLALAKIQGIEEASSSGISNFSLQISKATIYSWDELLPKILKVVQEVTARKKQLVEIGEAKKPSEEYLAALRREGCDV